MSTYTDLVPIPSMGSVNGGASPCPTRLIESRYGLPCARLGTDCGSVTVPAWKRRMVTKDVGLPYRLGGEHVARYGVTGHRMLIERLELALADLAELDPKLRAALGTAGALCPRKVRGGQSPSNHTFGTAIDFTIDGILDVRGDDKVQTGLLTLYSVMKRHDFYWGIEFGTEDAMHYELSGEVVIPAIRAGTF